jgi:hypothetical protein
MRGPIDRFPNVAADCDSVVLKLTVGPPDPAAYYDIHGTLIPRPDRWLEDWFVVDTGAARTCISGGLALELGLDLTGEIELVRQVRGGYTLMKVSALRVNIGCDWTELPCWVRWPVEQERQNENLLGLAGLLERYDVLLTGEEAAFYKRGILLAPRLS